MDLWLFTLQVAILCLVTRCKGQNGTVMLKAPNAGNCGDVTVLNCSFTNETCDVWLYGKDSKQIFSYNLTDPTKYNGSSSTLKINNTSLNDAGNYQCYCNTRWSNKTELKYECKPKEIKTSFVTPSKKLRFSVDTVYPKPKNISVTLENKILSGDIVCNNSTMDQHFECTWTSRDSLADVNSVYSVAIATVTETILTKTIRIVTPDPPSITGLDKLEDGRNIINKTEGKQASLVCVSRGGNPAPTLAWYRGNTSTHHLNTSSFKEYSNDTYVVTVMYTFIPQRVDDRISFICRSYYPKAIGSAARGSRESSVKLYLKLKPSKPIVTQAKLPVPGGKVTLECRTSGGRPAPNVTWNYDRHNYTQEGNVSLNETSETYSVRSTLQLPIYSRHNETKATCYVTHVALVSELSNSVNVYSDTKSPGPPSIVGQEQFHNGLILRKTEAVSADLVCESKGGFPSPTVAWYRDNVNTTPLAWNQSGVLQNDSPSYVVTVTYTFTPRRKDDCAKFICRAYYPQAGIDGTSSTESWETPVRLYLDLKPSQPEVVQTNKPVSGQNVTLECKTSGDRQEPSVYWTYGDNTFSPGVRTIRDQTTETYSVVSTLNLRVTLEDNGKKATCNVEHSTMKSALTGVVEISVDSDDTESSPSALGGILAGIATLFIVIAAIVVAIIVTKRRKSSNQEDAPGPTNKRTEPRERYEYVTENAMYISADEVDQPASPSSPSDTAEKEDTKGACDNDVYAVPDKSKKAGAEPSDLYAVPDKSKKKDKD